MLAPFQQLAPPGSSLTADQVTALIARACPVETYRGKRVVLIVPDNTRTAPVGQMFKLLHTHLAPAAKKFDVLLALGTHPAMSDDAINARVEITAAERAGAYRNVEFINHEWDNPAALRDLGVIPAKEISTLSGGLFAMDVPVHINRRLYDYDRIIICGPVFPHEVVGFSGGNKYLFPGVAGPGILNFFHWLGAVVTNPMIIGNKWTAVRKVVDRAGAMVTVPKLCFCLVIGDGGKFSGLFAGTPEEAWDSASDLSQQLHITYKSHPFQTVLSCAPPMYDELWVAGKCMYKLEPVVADGGELIIYAPHLHEVSITHGAHIRRIGYHCRDYFLKQWDKFKDVPWGTLAHSTHVHGLGTYDEKTGVETSRIRVTLATGLTEAQCREINLGYRDWRTIKPEDFANRESEGVLLVPKAGERLYHLRQKPVWAGGTAVATTPELIAPEDSEDEPGFVSKFLSGNGRIGRLSYFLRLLFFSVSVAVLRAIPAYNFPIVVILLYLALFYVLVVATAKRLHDLNLSAWFTFVIFVPFAGIALALIPGKEDWNNYGESPS